MAAAGLSELEQEFYKDIIEGNGGGDEDKEKQNQQDDDAAKAAQELADKQAANAKLIEEQEAANQSKIADELAKKEEEERKVKEAQTAIQTKSNKKYVSIDDEKSIYEMLDKKYRPDRMKPEEKALAFIAKENPGLEDDELMFIASSEYGIGVTKPDEAELTDEQVIALKKQDIARKQLFLKADNYFKDEASKIELNAVDPIEDNEEFKTYRQQQAEQAQRQAEQEQNLQNTIQQITKATNSISELSVPTEIDIDDRKFAVDVKFKVDADKQKQLIDYSKRYSPTDAEIAQFTDTEGKFDFKSYQAELANRLFYKDIVKAALRQGLSQDREAFIEKELKNSTLRNNDVSETVDKPFDFVSYYYDNYAGK